MNFGSKQCWMKPRAQYQQPQLQQQQQQQPMMAPQLFPIFNKDEKELDTNIVTIEFSNLKPAEESMQIGDPIFCKGCKVLLNQFSTVVDLKNNASIEKVEEEEEEESKSADKKPLKQEVPVDGTMKWTCEFCDEVNILNIEKEEIPKQDDVVYLVQSGLSKVITSTASDTAVVFVIDISGSMSVTVPLKHGASFKHSTKVSEQEFEMLKQFMDAQDIAQYVSMQANQKSEFVSRKQCILAAIQQQLEDLSETDPSKRVCLITFNNDVTIYGGGSCEPIILTGDKLFSSDEIWRIGSECSAKMLATPVCEAKDKLIEIFDNIKEVGQTALGPALLTSIAMLASGHSAKGSSVILCTDGLANIGVGSFEDADSSGAFFANTAIKAVESDIIFNVVSIKGEGCKLDVLGSIADQTGGNVLRVDPDNLHKDFANILKDEVVGLKAEMTIYLSKQMKFRHADEAVDKVDANGSKCVKHIGNITKNTVSTFEYTRKSDEEAAQQSLAELDPNLKSLPFQAQITYKNIAGHQMLRVITKQQEFTYEKEVASKSSNQQVIRQHVQQHTASLIQRNNYGEARMFNKGWENYIASSDAFGSEEQRVFTTENRQLKNCAKQKQTNFQRKVQPNPQPKSLQMGMMPPQQLNTGLFQAPSFSHQLPQIPQAQYKKELIQEEEDVFSGDEDENQDDDDCEAFMYQMKNQKK